MPDCIFCKIANKEIPSSIIYEDDKVIAFLDIKPVHPGYTLVIPKDHHQMMSDTPDGLIASVFVICKRLMRVIKRAFNADYVAVSVIGLDVPHFHVHVIPRYKNDGMAQFWPTKKYAESEAQKTAEKIRSDAILQLNRAPRKFGI